VYLFSDLGLRQAVLFVSRGDRSVCGGLLERLAGVRLIALVAGSIVGVGFTFGFVRGGGDVHIAAVLVVVSYALQSYARYLRTPLRAEARVTQEARLEALERIILIAAGVAAVFSGSLLVVGVTQVAVALFGLLLAIRVVGFQRGYGALTLDRSMLGYSLTVLIALGAPILYSRIDYLVLERIGTEQAAAVYAAAYSLLLAATTLQISLAEAAIGHLPGSPSSRQHYLRLIFAVSIAGGAAMALLGPFVVRHVFGLDHPALPVLCRVLGLAYAVMAVTSTIGILAPLAGRERSLLRILLVAFFVNLGLCVWLIDRIGMVGGAYATLLTEVFVGVTWQILRQSHRKSDAAPQPPVAVWVAAEG
jgi:O-antigen/teichoic acid export membrane protein